MKTDGKATGLRQRLSGRKSWKVLEQWTAYFIIDLYNFVFSKIKGNTLKIVFKFIKSWPLFLNASRLKN